MLERPKRAGAGAKRAGGHLQEPGEQLGVGWSERCSTLEELTRRS